MRRILLVMAAAALMVAALTITAAGAFAAPKALRLGRTTEGDK
jgi:hypothetical protein